MVLTVAMQRQGHEMN